MGDWNVVEREFSTDPYWEDLRFPATSINPPGVTADPDFDTTNSGWLFDATTQEILFLMVQLPHSWKEGSYLSPHVHWCKSTSADGGVAWSIDYKWHQIGEVQDADWTTLTSSTVAADTPDGDTANEHLITSLGVISGVGKKVSDMLVIKLSRLPGDSGDTYAADARLLEFDIHYQVNTLGSDGLYTKSVPV